MKITSIANCGLLIGAQQGKVLFDGLNGKYDCFSEVPAATAEDIIHGNGIFKDLDLMLFSHCHIDHLDCSKVLRCIVQERLKAIFLPDDTRSEVKELKSMIAGSGITMIEPDSAPGEMKKIMVSDLKISYFKTAHAGKDNSVMQHYSFLVEAEGKSIYISGDSDNRDFLQVELLKGVHISAAFYNPLFLSTSSGRSIIKAINSEKNFIYHLPGGDGDHYFIGKQAEHDLLKYGNVLPKCRLIRNEMTEVFI